MSVFSYLSVAVDISANLPYAFRVARGEIRPHPFTWLVWTLLTLMVAIIQYMEGAGGGGWLLINASFFSVLITILSFRYGTKDIVRSDYIILIFCLLCFPLYFVFDAPVLASLVITIIDIVSFIPMLRKTSHDPKGESAMFQWMMVAAYIFSLLAMETYSLATCLFPVAMVAMHGGTWIFILYLRVKYGHRLWGKE